MDRKKSLLSLHKLVANENKRSSKKGKKNDNDNNEGKE